MQHSNQSITVYKWRERERSVVVKCVCIHVLYSAYICIVVINNWKLETLVGGNSGGTVLKGKGANSKSKFQMIRELTQWVNSEGISMGESSLIWLLRYGQNY